MTKQEQQSAQRIALIIGAWAVSMGLLLTSGPSAVESNVDICWGQYEQP